MSKDELIAAFDPNAAAVADAGLFGLPFSAGQSDLIIIPVPWEVTVSSGSGTGDGPEAIREASLQVDLHHHDFPELWKRGIFMDDCPAELKDLGKKAKQEAQELIDAISNGRGIRNETDLMQLQMSVNAACNTMNAWVHDRCRYWKGQGKHVGVVGGDHSVPLGYLQLQGEMHPRFGILHIDAHMDLRVAYEGFTWSHASVFYNTLETVPQAVKLVQVGIRDYCRQEYDYVNAQPERIAVYYDRETRGQIYRGGNWDRICHEIISQLPEKVHVSVDIDGLDPKLCPNTGTPVPGGMEYEELVHLLNALKAAGKTIIGFDLCEVAPGNEGWDGNVGARMLFHLCGILAAED